MLEQYKAYLADVGNIGTRYATANGFYVTIISGLLAVLTLSKKGEVLERADVLLYVVVPIFACLLCLVWRESILFYSALFKIKFDVLRLMEKELPYQIFAKEEELRDLSRKTVEKGEEKSPKPRRRLLKNDEWIPIILCLPFLGIFGFGIWLALRGKF